MWRKARLGGMLVALGAVVALAACGPAPTTLSDTSAGNLDVTITIQDDLTSPGKLAAIIVSFDNGGRTVQFTNGESVTCDGVPLTSGSLGFIGGVPNHVPNSTPFTFVYTSQGVSTTYVWTPVANVLPTITS